LDFEETIRWAQTFNALVRPLVVVIFDPEFDSLASRIEAVELSPTEELLPEAFPEAFDLAQRHRMLWAALEVSHAIFFQFGLEPAGAAPGGILPAIVGEHLFGRLKLTGRYPVNFDHRLRRGAAEQIGAHDKARIIVQEGNQVGITPTEPKGEDVRLPHLIGGGPFEETRSCDIALLGRCALRHELSLMQMLPHRFGTGWQKEPTAQQLTDAFDAKGGMLLFEFDYLFGDRLRQFGRVRPSGAGL